MSTVAEIKSAIDKLSPRDRCELEALLHPWSDDEWDLEMQADSQSGGKLHKLMLSSRKNAELGKLSDFPPRHPDEFKS